MELRLDITCKNTCRVLKNDSKQGQTDQGSMDTSKIMSKEDARGSKWTVLGRNAWTYIVIKFRWTAHFNTTLIYDGPMCHGNDRHVWLRTDRFRPTVHLYSFGPSNGQIIRTRPRSQTGART